MNNSESIYKDIIIAKNGATIPLLQNNKTIESRYNPEAGCLRILETIKKTSGFLIILGYSSGILISEIIKKNPALELLIFETSQSDWEFLSRNNLLKNLRNVTFCDLSNLKQKLISKYIPALHGDFQIIEQQPWLEINKSSLVEIQSEIQIALAEIQQDYSTQAYFGKIWTNNIFNNLKICKKIKNQPAKIDTTKKAAVIAAGPSLDSTIHNLKKNRNEYVIFSTDTAFSVLTKHNIKPDFVISIDGQFISYNHFFNNFTDINFYFDICANFNCANAIQGTRNNLYFFTSGHPMAERINELNNNCFNRIYNGSGTVTIAAVDLAIKYGFCNIEVFGADFAYIYRKAYTKGTYLDKLYMFNSGKLSSIEKKFTNLLFRADLCKNAKNNLTTKLLESYRISFENYLNQSNCSFFIEDNIYKIHLDNKNIFESKKQEIIEDKIQKLIKDITKPDYLPCLLPLIAYLRKKDNNAQSFEGYVKLAHSIIISYN